MTVKWTQHRRLRQPPDLRWNEIPVFDFYFQSTHNPDMEHRFCRHSVIDNKPTLTIWWDIEGESKQTVQLFDKVKLKLTTKEKCMKLRAILIRDK